MKRDEVLCKGWIYRGHRAIPVDVLEMRMGATTCRVRFPTRAMGLRGSVRTVGAYGVSLKSPGLARRRHD